MRLICIFLYPLLCLLGGCIRTSYAQQIIGRPMLPLNPGCGIYVVETATYANSQLLRKASALTGLADSKAFTFSCWAKMAADGNTKAFVVINTSGASVRFQINRGTGNGLVFSGINSSGTTILDAVSTNSKLRISDGWVHIFVCVDLANSGNRHVYFNGVEDTGVTWTTYTNDTIDLSPTSPGVTIGANALDNNKFDGSMAEFWLDDVYLNAPLSFMCNTAGNHPINIGTTGNTPTGSAPAIYLSRNGSGNSWATDSSGNANNMTVTGTLSSTTPP